MQELGKVLVGWGGVACQGCDFTAQSSGLETGTPPDVACHLKGYHCVFELAAHQHLHHWRGAFTIRGSLKNNLSTGYGIQSCGRLPKVYSNGGLITLAADSLTLQNAVNVTIQPIVNITLMDLGNAGATNTFEKHAQQRSMGFQSTADA
jgi:hypothetical protein